MIETGVRVRLRPMRVADIPQVLEVDRLCFPTPWPARSYRYELAESRNSSMSALTLPDAGHSWDGGWLSPWLERLRFGPLEHEQLIGFSGFWHISDEVHISTIAVHPRWQGLRLGELLLFAMLRQSARRGARITTLEVRVSNAVAQNLYRKYGFDTVGRRKAYYRDNHEDAWMMSVRSGQQAYVSRLRELGATLFARVDVIDELG